MNTKVIMDEANKIIEVIRAEDLHLRLMGACAIRLHSPNFVHLYDKFDRSLSDLDFAGFNKEAERIETAMNKLGYAQDRRIVAFHQIQRNLFFHPENHLKVDIFFDKLAMCHTIDFKGRLELDFPTITPSDILLEKMQIVKITEKDLKDTSILLLEHPIGVVDKDTINVKYISKLLSNDWGFWYTFTLNLNKVKEFVSVQTGFLSDSDKRNIFQKLDILSRRTIDEPKTLGWKIRARVGPSVKWYNEVEDLVRT